MRGQWISKSSARLEAFSRLRLAERSAGWPDYAGAMAGAGGENWREKGGKGDIVNL